MPKSKKAKKRDSGGCNAILKRLSEPDGCEWLQDSGEFLRGSDELAGPEGRHRNELWLHYDERVAVMFMKSTKDGEGAGLYAVATPLLRTVIQDIRRKRHRAAFVMEDGGRVRPWQEPFAEIAAAAVKGNLPVDGLVYPDNG